MIKIIKKLFWVKLEDFLKKRQKFVVTLATKIAVDMPVVPSKVLVNIKKNRY